MRERKPKQYIFACPYCNQSLNADNEQELARRVQQHADGDHDMVMDEEEALKLIRQQQQPRVS